MVNETKEETDELKHVADVRFEVFGSSPGESCFSKEVAGLYATMIPKSEEDLRRFYELMSEEGAEEELPYDMFVTVRLRVVNEKWKAANMVSAEEILRRLRRE